MKRILLLIGFGALVSSSGCGEVECGPGTHRDGDECRASLTPECGPGTELQGGKCVSNQGGSTCGPGTHIEGNECVPDVSATGNAARFYDMTMSRPPNLAGVANGILSGQLMSGETLMFIGVYAPNEAILRLYGGSGVLEDDGTYTLNRTSSFDVGATTADGRFTSEKTRLGLFVTGPDPIILEDAQLLEGTIVDVDGVPIPMSFRILGVLTPENASTVFIEQANQTLDLLLQNLGEVPDVDYDMDGTAESYTVDATVETEKVWLF